MIRFRPWFWPTLWAAAGIAFGVLAERAHLPRSGGLAAADLFGGVAFLAAGGVVWKARPDNRCWWLLMASGTSWFVGTLQGSPDDTVSVAGFAFGGWYFLFLAWLLLAFPTGRLAGRRERGLLAVLTVLFTVRSLARLFLYVPPDGTGCACAPNRFLPLTDPRWYDAVSAVFPWAFVATFLGVVAYAIARWRRSSRAGRRMLAPVVVAATAVAVELGYDYLLRTRAQLVQPSREDLFYLVVAGRIATALAFLVGLLRLRSTRSAVVDLVGGLEAGGTPPDVLAAALKRALGDPSLELVPWSAADLAFVHPGGRSLELPVAEPGRAMTVIEHDAAPIAALVHDEALLQDPGLVSAITAAVRLTSDNKRLRDELRQQLAEVAASRSRIVAAGDAERRRIERDLHDGAQQRLVIIALALQLTEARMGTDADPATRAALKQSVKDLREAIDELRDLARGIHPAVLSESGLEMALEALADRSPLPVRLDVRLPHEPPAAATAAAYFAVSEGLTNVVKHARATAVRVEVETRDGLLHAVVADDGVGGADATAGSGLRGLADRIDVAGGSMQVQSPPGQGTRLEVELPCG